ncbi:MAG: acyl-CoA dehydrogenase family protein [Myxococcales bacterium]|nr:acyl-CoA dehydrogenase family protein [Myxococcales bacterium]MCB9530702.1 acyl-CoA dehydrogenase family protein [Myxococcales bacterium]
MSLEDFRAEAALWIVENAPRSLYGTRSGRFDGYWGGKKQPPVSEDVARWLAACVERGWTAPDWPTELGGGGLSRQHTEIISEILTELKLPPPLVGFGLAMIGPTLLDFGNDAQRAAHIPPIVRGEVRWCQGYSEPGAGSDLASLATRAVRDGDDFVIDGQKVWTSHADKSDWIFALVRTNPDAKKQSGITFILIDMSTHGVSTRPIELISGSSPFCEVFFENVRVPAANVVGQVDHGWTVAKALLGYERSMIGAAMGGQLRDAEADLVARARRALDAPSGQLPSALTRDEIADLAMDEACFNVTVQRVIEGMKGGKKPGSESSILKVVGSALKQRRFDLAVKIAGPESQGWEGDAFAADDLSLTRDWLRSRGNTIEGGTSEVQLNIIAKHVLGLP